MTLRVTLLLSVIVFLLSYLSSPDEPYSPGFPDTINAVIGDISFVEKFNREPNEFDSESTRIITHLEYVVSKLETAEAYNLSDEQLLNRKEIIGHLKKYIANQEFPSNYDYEETRRPTFINKDGNICAVGYLVAQTAGLEVAEALNEEFKYDYIYNMNSPMLDEWLLEFGLTKKEAAMIQPSYRPGPKEDNNDDVHVDSHFEISYGLGSALLAGTQIVLSGYGIFSDASSGTKKRALLGSAGLGVTSALFGLINLENSKSYSAEGDCCLASNFEKKNISRRNLSIANVAFGSASAIFNGLQYFSLKKEESQQALRVTTTQLYVPEINTMAPALNVNWRF